ncbi:MAG: glycosyltransferase [Oligoflexia bacterium]|nr:glycosyltransferase [Oligoflexia bacterium]MBF0364209.1 glycosyltransferase [Oligoflexia bacterium]
MPCFQYALVIPYYNERPRINYSVETLLAFLVEKRDIEIIYVNDGSNDDSENALKNKLSAHSLYKALIAQDRNIHFRFLSVPDGINLGKGGAIREGVLAATAPFIFYTDFDLAISLHETEKFLEVIHTLPDSRGIVVASRRQKSAILKNQSILRKAFGKIFNKLMKFIIDLPISDTQCGFKMMDQKSAQQIFTHLNIKGFAFDVEILKRALLLGIPVRERGVEIFFDDQYSTVNIYLDPLKMLFDLWKFKRSLRKDSCP